MSETEPGPRASFAEVQVGDLFEHVHYEDDATVVLKIEGGVWLSNHQAHQATDYGNFWRAWPPGWASPDSDPAGDVEKMMRYHYEHPFGDL